MRRSILFVAIAVACVPKQAAFAAPIAAPPVVSLTPLAQLNLSSVNPSAKRQLPVALSSSDEEAAVAAQITASPENCLYSNDHCQRTANRLEPFIAHQDVMTRTGPAEPVVLGLRFHL